MLKRLLPLRIDELLYGMPVEEALACEDPAFEVRHEAAGRAKESYVVAIGGETAHRSWLHWSVRLPRRFGFDGSAPVIGDCFTPERFRGRSIYPQVLRYIARDVARRASAPVYILVSPANLASIRGIEKAGFRRLARLQGTRIAGLLFGKRVEP